MDKVAIVLLNYLNYKDTIECIDSIEEKEYDNIEIIVVENGSKNGSWEAFQKEYSNKERIHIIQSEENVGFAKGNNIGIKYARNKLNCEFVLLANNDTIFTDKMFIKKLLDAYEDGVGVIGARIIERNGLDQNPVETTVTSERIEFDLKYIVSKKNKIRSSKIYQGCKTIFLNFKKLFSKNNSNNSCESLQEEASVDLVLHGACMLLTKDYFKFYPYLFPGTFLYYEENILTLLTKKVGLKKKFITNTSIYHKEDQSSEMSFNNSTSIKTKFLLESINKCKEIYGLDYKSIKDKYFNE